MERCESYFSTPKPWVTLPSSDGSEVCDEFILPQAHEHEPVKTDFYDHAVIAFDDKNHRRLPYTEIYSHIELKKSPGFVYAAAYDSAPGIIKLGLSKFHPAKRLNELTQGTAAPGQLKLLLSFQTPFRYASESAAHKAVKYRRIKGEFFRLNQSETLSVMLGLATMHDQLRYESQLSVTQHFVDECDAEQMGDLHGVGLQYHSNNFQMAA